MSVPLRKDQFDEDEPQLSTADLARGKRPAASQENVVPMVEVPADRPKDAAPEAGLNLSDASPLFPSNELTDLRQQWTTIQADFVDEPRKAVEKADGLVASAMQRLAEVFADERSKLEQQWDRGGDVSTEDLRIALQRYRSFFHRLLAI